MTLVWVWLIIYYLFRTDILSVTMAESVTEWVTLTHWQSVSECECDCDCVWLRLWVWLTQSLTDSEWLWLWVTLSAPTVLSLKNYSECTVVVKQDDQLMISDSYTAYWCKLLGLGNLPEKGQNDGLPRANRRLRKKESRLLLADFPVTERFNSIKCIRLPKFFLLLFLLIQCVFHRIIIKSVSQINQFANLWLEFK